jgi:hypothetical protein
MRRAAGALLAAALLLGADASPTPAPSPTAVPSGAAFRADFLALSPAALALRGGTTLHVAPTCACAHDLRAGESVVFTLDAANAVVTLARFVPAKDASALAVAQLPHGAAVAVSGAANADATLVTVRLEVEVPSQTPQSDDVYVSTERSGYTPNERRMNRIDERRWSLSIEGPSGSELHYQYTRGTFGTLERDKTNTVRPDVRARAASDARPERVAGAAPRSRRRRAVGRYPVAANAA